MDQTFLGALQDMANKERPSVSAPLKKALLYSYNKKENCCKNLKALIPKVK